MSKFAKAIPNNPYAVYVDGKLAYNPSDKQIEFHKNPAKYRLYGGAKGGGKSLCLLWEAMEFCQRIPGCNVLLLRRTYPDLQKTLMDHFEKKVPSSYYGGPRSWNHNDHVVTFRNGSKLWFGTCQHEHDVYTYNGGEYVFIGIDEATEWTYEMFQYLTLQNRCPIKEDKDGRPVVPCMALASNPGGIGSDWIEALFIGKKDESGKLVRNFEIAQKYTHKRITKYDPSRYSYIFSSVYDNPAYKDDQEYISTLESASSDWKARYLYGSWDTVAGMFFERFDPAVCVYEKLFSVYFSAVNLTRRQHHHDKWIGIDWGYQHHCAVFWASKVTLPDENGDEYEATLIYREMVVNKTGEAELAELIAKECVYIDSDGNEQQENIAEIFLSPDCWAKRTSQNTIAEEIGNTLSHYKLPYPTVADDDRVGGARLMDEMLSSRPNSKLLISSECDELIEAIPRMQRDEKNDEDVKKTKTKNDDIYDGCRYTLKSQLAAGKTSFEMRRQKILSQCTNGNEKLFVDLRLRAEKKRGNGIVFGKPRSFGRPSR